MAHIPALTSLPEEFDPIAKILQLDAQLLGDYSVKAVNGRHLYDGLEIAKDYTNWSKNQIERFDFKEGEDFEVLSDLSSPSSSNAKARPQEIKTYVFTIDAAKMIAGQTRGKQGLTVMKYFLHMEKVAQGAYRGEVPGQLTGTAKENLELLAIVSQAFQPGAKEAIMHNGVRAFAPHLSGMLPELVQAAKSDVVHSPETGLGLSAVKTQAAGIVEDAQSMFSRYDTNIGFRALSELGYGVRVKYYNKGHRAKIGNGPFMLTDPSCYDPKTGFIHALPAKLNKDKENIFGMKPGAGYMKYSSFVTNVPKDILDAIAQKCQEIWEQDNGINNGDKK